MTPSPSVADISREIVGLYSHHFGLEPTMARALWREDIFVCVLTDVFTGLEQLLVDAGKFEQVRANRSAVQEAVEPSLRRVVEQATGSRVLACLSQVSAEGVACEAFLLERPSA